MNDTYTMNDIRCPYCHSLLRGHSDYCPHCGRQIIIPKCRRCGAEVHMDDAYCPKCGSREPISSAERRQISEISRRPPRNDSDSGDSFLIFLLVIAGAFALFASGAA